MRSYFESIYIVSLLRFLPACVLLWLAFRFGRTLCSNQIPLIQQIAKLRNPELSVELCRYTKVLTTIWFLYFVLAFIILLIVNPPQPLGGLVISLFSFVFFLGEYWFRPFLFPNDVFPSIRNQLTDTWFVWRQKLSSPTINKN